MNFAKMLTDALPASTRNDLSNRLGAFLATYEQLQADAADIAMKQSEILLVLQSILAAYPPHKEEAPVEEAPVEEAPVEEAPAEEAPVEESPAEETPAEETV